MTRKARQTEWSRAVKKIVRRYAAAGIRVAPSTKMFEWCEHVAVSVDDLDGVGVIHQNDPQRPFNFCVFEPSNHEKDGFTEIFERIMNSLDELPQRVEEWRSFRSKTDNIEIASGLIDHRKWLGIVAKDKQRIAEQVRKSGQLRSAGDGAAAWHAAGFDVKVKRRLPADTPPLAKKHLIEDLDAIAPDLLAWHLPRDEKGKWILKRRAPLFRYDGEKRRMMTFCLLVAMPEKRRNRPELRAEWLQADLQTARLDAVREKFDTRLQHEFAPELLGTGSQHAMKLWSNSRKSRAIAARCMRLQYEGRFEEAGQLVDIEIDDLILDCLRSRRVAHMCTCCAPLDRQLMEWSTLLKRTLTALNFPRVRDLALRDQDQCQRKPRKDPIPIIPFPLQRHIRKAHIALDIRTPEQPRLTIETTGSGNRLPIALWRRPVDVDLLHEGLLDPHSLPESVASQLGIAESAH